MQFAIMKPMLERFFQHQFWTPFRLTLFLVIQYLVYQLTGARMLGIGFTALTLVQLLPVVWVHRQTLSRVAVIQATLAILLSLFVWWRDDQLVAFFSLVMSVVLTWAVLHEAFTGQQVTLKSGWRFLGNWWHQFFFYSKTVVTTLTTFLPKWPEKKGLFSWRPKHTVPFARILLGGIVALPVFGVLLMLFAAADEQFATILTNISSNFVTWLEHFFTLEWLFEQWQKVQSVVTGLIVFWLYVTAIFPIPGKKEQRQSTAKSLFVEKATAAILIMVPFVAFIGLQLHLLPTMFESFRTGAVNPALTIRESFAQLFLACAIGLGMALFFSLEKTVTKSKYLGLVLITIGLIAEVFLVSFNAGYRLWIYQYLHGYTIYRIWGALMLAWLWGTLLWSLFPLKDTPTRQLKPQVAVYGITSFSVVVLVAGLLNIHNLVMQNKPIVDEKIDWGYLGQHISADGRRGFITALGKLNTLRDECPMQLGETPVSASCLRLVAELQPEYQALEHFNQFVYARLDRQFNYYRYDQLYDYENPRAIELITRDCQNVISNPKPWWERRGWDWHSAEICDAWLNDWAELMPVYQRLQEQLSPDSTATVKVLSLDFGNISPNSSPGIENDQTHYSSAELANAIEYASTPRGSETPLVDYQIVELRRKEKSALPISTYSYPSDYFSSRADRQYANIQHLFDQEGICELVNQDKVDEVWIWVPDMGTDTLGNSIGFRSYGVLSQENPIWVGNMPISETDFFDQPPAPCEQTVAFSMFNQNMPTDDHMRIIANRMYMLADFYNKPALTSFTAFSSPQINQSPTRFVDGQPVWACGTLAMPPNILPGQFFEFQNDWYSRENQVLSDCDDWNVNRTGEVAQVSCTTWGCSPRGFYNWWLGSLTENMQLKVEDGSKPWPNLWRAAVR